MTKFTVSIESERSEDIAYLAQLGDLFISRRDAKIQPGAIKEIFEWLFESFFDYVYFRREWNEQEYKMLMEICDTFEHHLTNLRDGMMKWHEEEEEA